MPINTDISDLWWLRQEKPESSVPALALGAQIAQRKADSIRQAEALKTRTAMGMMNLMLEQQRNDVALKTFQSNLMLEQQRNDVALKTFQSKQTSDLLKQQGMAEVGEYMAKVVSEGRASDPEARAGLYRLGAKWPQALDTQMLNAIDDNIFKAAADREDKARAMDIRQQSVDTRALSATRRLDILEKNANTAEVGAGHRMEIAEARLAFDRAKDERNERHRSALLNLAEEKLKLAEAGGTAQTKNDLYAQDLIDRASALEAQATPETMDAAKKEADSLRSRAAGVRGSGRLVDPSGPATVEEAVAKDGSVYHVVLVPGARPFVTKPVDTSKLSKVDEIAMRSELTALTKKWENYSKDMKGPDGKLDPAIYDKMREDIIEKYQNKTAGATRQFKYDYNPTTGVPKRIP